MHRLFVYKPGVKQTILAIAAVLAVLGGCVEREMTLITDPPGALVYVSEKEIGRTPVTQPFLWYGDYEIIVRREGYQALHTHADLRPPVYEIFPLDLLSAIVPWTYHDRRYLHFTLEPLESPTDDALVRRAMDLGRACRQPVDR